MTKVLELFGEPIQNGGQESFVINVLTHMDPDGLQIDLLTPHTCDNAYYKSLVEERGGRVYALGLPHLPGQSRDLLKKPLAEFFAAHSYDVVHVHSGSISVLAIGADAARKAGVKKIIVHSHCAAEKKTWKYRLAKLAAASRLKTAPTDYCACSQVAAEWKFPEEIAREQTKIMKNGVDLDLFRFRPEIREQMRKELGIAPDAFVMGHVGRFSYQKNHEYLVRVFQKVYEQVPDSRLLLVGSGELEEAVRSQLNELGLTPYVIFAGNVTNVQDYLSVMDVFVLPSRFEGLPIVGVEAQANGLPVLVSENVSGELKLSDAVEFFPLEDENRWVTAALERRPRADYAESLKRNGYDINETAAAIRKMYVGE